MSRRLDIYRTLDVLSERYAISSDGKKPMPPHLKSALKEFLETLKGLPETEALENLRSYTKTQRAAERALFEAKTKEIEALPEKIPTADDVARLRQRKGFLEWKLRSGVEDRKKRTTLKEELRPLNERLERAEIDHRKALRRSQTLSKRLLVQKDPPDRPQLESLGTYQNEVTRIQNGIDERREALEKKKEIQKRLDETDVEINRALGEIDRWNVEPEGKLDMEELGQALSGSPNLGTIKVLVSRWDTQRRVLERELALLRARREKIALELRSYRSGLSVEIEEERAKKKRAEREFAEASARCDKILAKHQKKLDEWNELKLGAAAASEVAKKRKLALDSVREDHKHALKKYNEVNSRLPSDAEYRAMEKELEEIGPKLADVERDHALEGRRKMLEDERAEAFDEIERWDTIWTSLEGIEEQLEDTIAAVNKKKHGARKRRRGLEKAQKAR